MERMGKESSLDSFNKVTHEDEQNFEKDRTIESGSFWHEEQGVFEASLVGMDREYAEGYLRSLCRALAGADIYNKEMSDLFWSGKSITPDFKYEIVFNSKANSITVRLNREVRQSEFYQKKLKDILDSVQ